jgi:hypothetical protein
MKKAVIFAPFWRQPQHVGNLRVDRFVRWLVEDGYNIVIIRAGSKDSVRDENWGIEISVRDSSGYYLDQTKIDPLILSSNKSILRRALSFGLPKKFRHAIVSWIFNPDPSVVWARLAASHPVVLDQVADATFILSSSPPDSAHVGAWKLARRFEFPHIVDMRDGWLDDPLKPLLRSSALRRWQEGRLESCILQDASAIQVTSDVWQTLLCKRLPELAHKVSVLTNGYPKSMQNIVPVIKSQNNSELLLIHAGKFLGSMLTRSPNLLLTPLLQLISQHHKQGTVSLIGSLSDNERAIVARFESSFLDHGWRLECIGNVSRDELFRLLPKAGGLLLLAEKFAAIPCKLFEYIPTGRPILVVTERGSATWRICEQLPQAFLVELVGRVDTFLVNNFLEACSKFDNEVRCPREYTEVYLSKLFRQTINNVCSSKKV